jgi:hypothetical protein
LQLRRIVEPLIAGCEDFFSYCSCA